MNSKNKSIVLFDQMIDVNSDWLEMLNCPIQDVVILDPVFLFSEIDWTRYEDNARVIHTIYSRLFEEVVMHNKRLVCFWPLSQQLGQEWFELATLCKVNSCELSIYKNPLFQTKSDEISDSILQTWKEFTYFLIESLLEDIHLNEQFDEVATLKSQQETIIIFKLQQEGRTRYAYASESVKLPLDGEEWIGYLTAEPAWPSFESFDQLLENLLAENDLSLFDSKFQDRSLEKAYFTLLSKEFKSLNLIENWMRTYSMN